MLTNFQIPASQAKITKQRIQGPAFPLSSPHHEAPTKFKPANGGASLASNDAFLSPNPFASSSSEADDDSGSSSGQDEFHLERYSQEANRSNPLSRLSRKRSRRQKLQEWSQPRIDKKVRPGLNIVTNFSTQPKRSKTDGLIVDKVQSQRPQLGPRFATSIKSAKAEHMDHSVFEIFPEGGLQKRVTDEKTESSKRAVARQAVSKLQESQIARQRAADLSKTKETMHPTERSHPTTNELHLQQPSSAASGHSPGARTVVVGMSVPADQADAHRSAGGFQNFRSANTPDTPAIVITPAEESESWKPAFFNKPRPPSSLYSPYIRTGLQPQHFEPPPVPEIPAGHAQRGATGQFSVGVSILPPAQDSPQSYEDDSYSNEDSDDRSVENVIRNSTDSHEPIVPSNVEDRRHISQGWWNLMLSPMLSRKGTIAEKGNDQSPETPPVPAIPADRRLSKSDVVSPLTSESPETPRRAGLASARASVWSRWTTWERKRDGKSRSSPGEATALEAEEPRNMLDGSIQAPPLPAVDNSKGLAGEYYRACAFEQLTGVPYFACENHSCAEQLPKFRSVFDKGSIPEFSADAAAAHAPNTSTVDEIGSANTPGENAWFDSTDLAKGDLIATRGMSTRSEPEQLSPNIRHADTAIVVKAQNIDAPESQQESQQGQSDPQTTQLDADTQQEERPLRNSATLRQEHRYPNIAAVPLPNLQPPILSPGPVSPAMQRTMTSEGAVPMTQIDHHPSQPRLLEQSAVTSQPPALAPTQPPSVIIHNHTIYSDKSSFGNGAAVEEARREAMERLESAQAYHEVEQPPKAATQEDPKAGQKEKKSVWSRLKSLIPKRKAAVDVEPDNKKKHHWTLIISIVLFLTVLACVLLATLLTRTGNGTLVQSQWLNLTGYPPIPTGISTIARPDVIKQQSKCVAPSTVWSCALPKENQFEVAPNSPDQPNFRFQITFRNGSVPANMTVPVQNRMKRSLQHLDGRANDPFTNDLFIPNPSPPSRADQIFMGNTTDNVTQPFEGEQTPFFITFVPVFPVNPSNLTSSASNSPTSTLGRRQTTNSSNDIIPDPDTLDDGSAAPANLLPTDPAPTSQPIRLYNRGQADEHYGFYMYYDKAIFLHSTAPLNTSELADNGGIDSQDENGGSTRDQSRLRCTFSQTRFLVRMWTNSAFGATLLPPIVDNGINTTKPEDRNSATDFSRPGSFPYPTTISIDRHGGNINKKAVYCYGVDALQVIQNDVKTIVGEFRSAEGTIINPAPALVNGTVSGDDSFDQEAGGIDGGTGGCECVWQNWS